MRLEAKIAEANQPGETTVLPAGPDWGNELAQTIARSTLYWLDDYSINHAGKLRSSLWDRLEFNLFV